MAINFCFDQLGTNPGLGYPNLAKPGLSPDDFDVTWPLSIPLRLMMYLRRANWPFQSHTVDTAPVGSWYPVALGWHDHKLNYFSLMSKNVHKRLRTKQIKVLFYYHEGDNPETIKQLLDYHCRLCDLPTDCYVFISANSACVDLDNFYYFSDHEHFFQYINRGQRSGKINSEHRPYQFTALNRTHKWWRASVMSDLWRHDLLTQSLWSYNTNCVINDDEKDNPVRVHEFSDWYDQMQKFLINGPYHCDGGNDTLHNDHRQVNLDLYRKSYCNLVIETHLDADASGGAFITEKTYKCLKYGQPFIVIGPPGSLAVLRNQGYRVFDHALDNNYDTIVDNTARWLAVRNIIHKLSQIDMHCWFQSCLDDLNHNQQLFRSRQKPDLLRLAQYLDAVK